jgi:hypothetical protein
VAYTQGDSLAAVSPGVDSTVVAVDTAEAQLKKIGPEALFGAGLVFQD